MRWKTFELIQQLETKSPERQKEIATIVLAKIANILKTMPAQTDSYHLKFKKYVLEYLERELIDYY